MRKFLGGHADFAGFEPKDRDLRPPGSLWMALAIRTYEGYTPGAGLDGGEARLASPVTTSGQNTVLRHYTTKEDDFQGPQFLEKSGLYAKNPNWAELILWD